ncbi:PEP-CTERM sorting domain-containing protein [Pelagerythrobacter marensis]|uniref:PEP-CTERM sorting domain-containing protein n=1 Tax=Pelagerythrobacter marensis TaxID=543877 RepID=A0ABZ2D6E2_9SPHN
MRVWTILSFGLASPAMVAGATPLPEPSNLALFGLGLAGLVIGRRIGARARRKRPD